MGEEFQFIAASLGNFTDIRAVKLWSTVIKSTFEIWPYFIPVLYTHTHTFTNVHFCTFHSTQFVGQPCYWLLYSISKCVRYFWKINLGMNWAEHLSSVITSHIWKSQPHQPALPPSQSTSTAQHAPTRLSCALTWLWSWPCLDLDPALPAFTLDLPACSYWCSLLSQCSNYTSATATSALPELPSYSRLSIQH